MTETSFQAEPTVRLPFAIPGGVNAADFSGELINRSHIKTGDVWRQVAPMESPEMPNIDFFKNGWGTRLGSAESADLTGVMVANEALIDGYEWRSPATNARINVLVGVKSIYTNQSGSFAQVNDSGGVAYVHNADVSKLTFTSISGHLLIGLDGPNQIQVYRYGADLDDEMFLGNTWEQAYGSVTETITGVWTPGTYLTASIHDRLVFSTGEVFVEVTPSARADSTGIWDLAGTGNPGDQGTFYEARGRVIAMTSYVGEEQDLNRELMHLFTSEGPGVLTGFQEFDQAMDQKKTKGGVPINHRCVVQAKNWLVVLTKAGNIEATNGLRWINLGRRLRSFERDGPLDEMDTSDTQADTHWGTYDSVRERAIFGVTTSDLRQADKIFIVDFSLGEPVIGEPQDSFEKRVRLLHHTIKDPDANDWFIGAYGRLEGMTGITAAGKLWTIGGRAKPRLDLGALTIEDKYLSPLFVGDSGTNNNQWMYLDLRGTQSGDWNSIVKIYKDRSTVAAKSYSFPQLTPGSSVWEIPLIPPNPTPENTWGEAVWGGDSMTKKGDDTDLYSQALQFEISLQVASQFWLVTNGELQYQVGAIER